MPLDRFKRCAAALALVAAAVLHGSATAGAAGIGAGDQAPAFTLPAADGTAVSLASLRGRTVYLDFWASWCAPCRKSFPWMNAIDERHGPDGLTVVGINVDQRPADATRFLAEVPVRFRILYDARGQTPEAFGVRGMPSSFLIDPDGKVVLAHAGFRDEDRAVLEASIRQTLDRFRRKR